MNNENDEVYVTGYHEYDGCMSAKNYLRLIDIARENDIFTFDINDVISFLIKNFPRKK